jgi:hypothetical protein
MREVPVTGGHIAFVDDDDAALVAPYSWHIVGKYPGVTVQGKKCLMHRLLIGEVPPGMVIDHIDGNRFNNRRTNLRVVTVSQNCINRHTLNPTLRHRNNKLGYRGVVQRRSKFYGHIRKGGLGYYTKSFSTPLEAAIAWDALAIRHFGEFATLNFPECAR